MVQFKEKVFHEALTESQRRMILRSMRHRKTEHFLQLPPECPRSDIIFGKITDYRIMAREIYLKYVKRGSHYEINVEWATRRELADVIETTRWAFNEEYSDPLKL